MYEIDREGFRYSALEFVAEGEGELQIDGQWFRLKPGSVFTYGPGVSHRLRSRGKRSLVEYFVDFAGPETPRLLETSGLTHRHPHQLVRTRWIHDIFDQLLDSGSYTRRVASQQCDLLVRLLLTRLKMDYAADLFTRADMPVQKAAEAVGFADPYHFPGSSNGSTASRRATLPEPSWGDAGRSGQDTSHAPNRGVSSSLSGHTRARSLPGTRRAAWPS